LPTGNRGALEVSLCSHRSATGMRVRGSVAFYDLVARRLAGARAGP
jgi:hypothetical protein